MKKIGLGKGLKALIPEKEVSEERIVYIPLEKIFPNPEQPRREFSEESLQELADSIKEKGILQPLILKKTGENYQLVCGERRYRAAIKAGLEKIPAIIKEYDLKDSLEASLIENLQREDLNPIEKAFAYKKLREKFNYTQEELAKKLGKSRSEIANTLRLLNLPQYIQESLLEGKITEGHARLLVSVEEEEIRRKIYKKILEEKLSVRMVEALLKETPVKRKRKKPEKEEIYLEDVKEKLQIFLGTKVSILRTGEKGYLKIEFYSEEDLQRILEKIIKNEFI